MKWIVLFISILIFAGCKMKNSELNSNKKVFSMNQPLTSVVDLKKAVLYEGSKEAYDALSTAYLDYTFQEEFLLYAIIMANKYEYPQAYFDVYFWLTQTFSSDINNIDESSANLAIEYLIKASEKNHRQAKEIVEEYAIVYNERKNKEQILKIFE
ncbi:MAG: hypothetical protein JW973_13940 [Bacteroidales bacterium]|nr:hypothetical protein [Bacteroidales bacterium]